MHFNRIFLCFFCFFLILCACQSTALEDPTAKEPIKAVGNADFISTLTFLGDSTTAHMASRADVLPSQIWASKSRYLNLSSRITYEKIVCPTNGEEMTIAEVAKAIKPRQLVITLGIDYGVYYYREDPQTFALYYEKLLDAIGTASPETTLILQAIFPVGRGSTAITNEMVLKANRTIAEIAAKRGLTFVDATQVLTDSEGYLREEFCYSEDGIHLTSSAYKAILENLKKYEGEVVKA
ncbi:MAG: hypothetical protein IKC75_06255 [Clostridia bacterium]|nr:hypothetical protein [Clostridia bacterium]